MAYLPISEWEPPEDPIFGLTAAFRRDDRPNKVNLVIGAYRTATGDPYVLLSVRTAEQQLWEKKANKEYLPIDGDADFCRLSTGLILGPLQAEVQSNLMAAQMIGGTGALRIGGEYLAFAGPRTVYVPSPTWANHKGVFGRAGLKVETYPYYDRHTNAIDFPALCHAVKQMPAGSVILLHGCCHNPTGLDLSFDHWQELSHLLQNQGVIPFFDLAYQGLGDGLDADARAVRYFVEQGHELLVAQSYSKNFGLYNERVGLLLAVTRDSESAELVGKQIKTLIRTSYSNPASHGARVITTILHSPELRKEWLHELEGMRQRVVEMRKALLKGLQARGYLSEDSPLFGQKGLFSYGLLNADQVQRLRSEFAIYVPDDGRINVAGLTAMNLPYLIDAILAVS